MGNTVNRSAKVHSQTTTTITNRDDYLSSLPDCLLVSILSLLPTETAIATSVLSHRWQHLWTQLPLLSFTGPLRPLNPTFSYVDEPPEFVQKFNNFLAAVDKILNHMTSPKIHTFDLIMEFPRTRDHDDLLVGSWVRQVCSRHPEDLTLDLRPFDLRHPVKVPAACIFQCDTLVSLRLGYALYDWVDNENEVKFNLPNLKVLRMLLVNSFAKSLTALLKSCPLLEELYVHSLSREEKDIVVEIFCDNLKSLKLDVCIDESVEFLVDAPKLVTLSLESYRTRFRFVNPPCELAQVKFYMSFDELDFVGRVREPFNAMYSTRSLNIYGHYLLKYFGEFENRGVPVFQNLTKLTVGDLCVDDLMLFLMYCPNLEVLVLSTLRGPTVFADGYEWVVPQFVPACLFAKLRVLELELNNRRGTDYHLGFMEYMLRSENVLEKLFVGFVSECHGHNARDKELEYCDKLFLYRRNSSFCEIHFAGQHITQVSTG